MKIPYRLKPILFRTILSYPKLHSLLILDKKKIFLIPVSENIVKILLPVLQQNPHYLPKY